MHYRLMNMTGTYQMMVQEFRENVFRLAKLCFDAKFYMDLDVEEVEKLLKIVNELLPTPERVKDTADRRWKQGKYRET